MTAPEKMPDVIWAQAEHEDDPKYGSFWIASKVAMAEPYHHQRVVDELVGALDRLHNLSSHDAAIVATLIAKHRKAD